MTVSEWADDFRKLSPEASAEPGDWNTADAEFQRGIMDAFNDPKIHTIVVQKGAQVGWTEIINNAVGYVVDQDPGPILLMQPTVEMAQTWSKDRLEPMLRDTKRLHGKFQEKKSRDSGNTLRQKKFPGGHITIVGANSPAGLRSRPIRYIFADEVDGYKESAGKEGDPLKLAAKRQSTFLNRKTILGSTPTLKDQSIIEREYEKSDKRLFFVPCPHCGHHQTLKWSSVKWGKTDEGEHLPETAYIQCENDDCNKHISDAQRVRSMRKGHWKATAPSKGIAGFKLNGLYSPWLTLEEMVTEFVEAKDRPELLKVFVNTVLGDTWEEKGETIRSGEIAERVQMFGPTDIPERAVFLTAGVDTQGDRLEATVVAWGAKEESWVVLHEVLYGDPAQEDVWNELDETILKEIYKTEAGRILRIKAACVDSGGNHTEAVLNFCQKRRKRRIYAIKGQGGPREIWPRRHSRSKTNKTLYVIGVDTAKEVIWSRLKIQFPAEIEMPTPSAIHFSADLDSVYFTQLTNEKPFTRYRQGKPYRVWDNPKKRRNEPFDCLVYALAARKAVRIKLNRPAPTPAPKDPEEKPKSDPDKASESAKPEPSPPPVKKKKKRRPAPRRSNFLDE